MEKMCSTCGNIKNVTEFNKRRGTKDGLSYSCKVCTRARSKDHYDKNTSDYKSRSLRKTKNMSARIVAFRETLLCERCGEKDPACLDFHHVDTSEKEANVTSIASAGMGVIVDELNKCICVCVNCHRKIHYYGIVVVPRNLGDEFKQYVESLSG